MLFRVLGCLETRTAGGGPVRLGAAKHRVLLAILLLEANKPVHAGRVMTALWPGRPPRSAAAVLRTYVSALRRSLGLTSTGQAALLSVPGGYRLRVEPADLDLLVFADLHQRGRQALTGGDVAGAAELLRGALDLWRGQPLEDVPLDGEWIARLDELAEARLAAVEAWAEAALATGRHHDVAAELAPVVAAHPLRELLCEHWMLALYRAGRQADALGAYQRLRREMVAELGVEPGPALSLLLQRILDVDPALRPPAGHTSPVVPRQLPPGVTGFTGRGKEIDRLSRLLAAAGTVAIAVVEGPGGIGKSALAVHVGHLVAHRFPDGQLYVDLQGATAGPAPLAPMAALGRLLRALGVSGDEVPDTVAEASAVFRALTAGSRLLVVLDNAGDAAQVRPLLPAGAGCAVLVTSRQVLATLDSATHLQLDVLAPRESLALLGSLVGATRIAADSAGAARIAELCGHLPLALRIAAARLAARPSWPAGALAARLADASRRLDELQFADLGVRASFQVSYQSIVDRELAAAYPLLSVLDGPELSLSVAARLLDRDERWTEESLERLVDARLLETPVPHRYRLHDLLRLFARELAEQIHPPAARAAAVSRAVEWYTATAWETFRLLRPGDTRLGAVGGMRFADAGTALAWLEAERANLVATVRQGQSVALAQALFAFFQVRSHWHDLIAVNQVALAAARRAGDLAAQAQACCDLNVAYDLRGRYDQAIRYLTEGLRIFRLLGDKRGQGACLNGLGVVYDSQQRYAEAKACLEQSLAVRAELADRRGQALSLNNLGVVHKRLDQHEAALGCYERALVLSEQLGDHRLRAGVLTNVGEVYEWQGRGAEALACHERSMRLFRRLGDRQGQALNLGNRGRLYQHGGDYRQARACLEECLAIQRELGDRRGQAECLQQLGALLAQFGDTAQAHARWRAALVIFTDLGLPAAAAVSALLD